MSRGARGLAQALGVALGLCVLGCASGLPAPTAQGRERIATRWPSVALADLERGRTLYAGRCASCHRLFEPATYPAARWEQELAEMRERAGLDDAEERSILQYLVSVTEPARAAFHVETSDRSRKLEF